MDQIEAHISNNLFLLVLSASNAHNKDINPDMNKKTALINPISATLTENVFDNSVAIGAKSDMKALAFKFCNTTFLKSDLCSDTHSLIMIT